ncbi:MAG: DUF433 domain-containing protein [Planctomycetia bacterium]
MSRLDVYPLIAGLDQTEREELLAALSEDVLLRRTDQDRRPGAWIGYPSIVSTPNVCGGSARLIRTRIPIWLLEQWRRQGMSEIDVLRSYPTLNAADLVAAWSYVAQNKDEIEREIKENEEE